MLNFNVGEGVKFALPNVFWTRLTSKYGTVSTLWCFCILLFISSNNNSTFSLHSGNLNHLAAE